MDDSLTLEIIAWDVSPPAPGADAAGFTESVAAAVLDAWQKGAHAVLLPEFLWMGLAAEMPKQQRDAGSVAEQFRERELPRLLDLLSPAGQDRLAVLGTCPWRDGDGPLLNRALVWRDGDLLHQDKLHLTPWENLFQPGGRVQLIRFRGFTLAVVICLDIEVPELAAALRGRGIDLILCPSATETPLGVERVGRCASARAVELGCHVAVAHLLGGAPSDLVDKNFGRAAFYSPSQHPFSAAPRSIEGPLLERGNDSLRLVIQRQPLDRMRRRKLETNPALLAGGNAAALSWIELA
jgi:predicted amidohydrolase